MRLCVVIAGLSSDETDDNYPRANVCNECLKSKKDKIVAVEDWFDKSFGDRCYFCDKTKTQEGEYAKHLRFRH